MSPCPGGSFTARRLWQVAVALVFWGAPLLESVAWAQDGAVAGGAMDSAAVLRSVGLATTAAMTITLSVLGAAYAMARIGSAALGASAEKPELLGRSVLLVAMAEGLAVLGFAIAMVLAQKI